MSLRRKPDFHRRALALRPVAKPLDVAVDLDAALEGERDVHERSRELPGKPHPTARAHEGDDAFARVLDLRDLGAATTRDPDHGHDRSVA